MESTADYSSRSNVLDCTVTDISLDWSLDFSNKRLYGTSQLTVKVLASSCKEVHLDSRKLIFHNQQCWINDQIRQFTLADTTDCLGSRIIIPVPSDLQHIGSSFVVKIGYSIGEECSAMQWLEASATKGGDYPYVFTQSCAIHSRSLFPCMDTPSVRSTFTARVTCPSWCTVLMSGLLVSKVDCADTPDNTVFTWHQPIPIPAYLIALAAGNLASRDVSDRVRIWSEPEVVDAAHYEFAQTEEFLTAAEEITGCPYQWGRYDVLCLPPSFPYGGMENPCLTFVTPTLLAGDRSLADVVAHEIAHSWTGNLVTNHTWDHFWLNEGWTMWLERKIVSQVRGSDEHFKLSAQSGWKHLQDEISLSGPDGLFTSLVWPLRGQDPDDAFSIVPYEKGFNLLYFLETVVGREAFESFAKSYIDKFKYSTVTSAQFRDHFVSFVAANAELSAEAQQRVRQLDWEALLLDKGMPTHPAPDFSNSLATAATTLAERWIDAASTVGESTEQFSHADIEGWSSLQFTVFLDLLLTHVKNWASFLASNDESEQEQDDQDAVNNPFSLSLLQSLDSHYSLSDSPNAEIAYRWFTLAVQMDCEWVVPRVLAFVTSQGRMKYVRPLYRTLLQSQWSQLARDTFQSNQHKYHPIARKMVAGDIRVAESAAEEEEEK